MTRQKQQTIRKGTAQPNAPGDAKQRRP
jgi:hypothetical protein